MTSIDLEGLAPGLHPPIVNSRPTSTSKISVIPEDARQKGLQRLQQAVNFFRSYKKADPFDASERSPVSFAFGGKFLDASLAMAVIQQGHNHWCSLIASALNHARNRESTQRDDISLAANQSPVVRRESLARECQVSFSDHQQGDQVEIEFDVERLWV